MGQYRKKEKTGRPWFYRFWHQSRLYKQEGFSSQYEAMKAEVLKREEIRAPAVAMDQSISLRDLSVKYLKNCRLRMRDNTIRQKKFVYNSVLNFIGGDLPADALTRKPISEYLDSRATRNGNKCANRDLREMKALYNWGKRVELIYCRNPCEGIESYPEDPVPRYVPPVEDVAKVKLAADRNERDFIEVIYHTGARKSEVVRLTWEHDINFEQHWIRLLTRKRRGGQLEEDYIPMNHTIRETLQNRYKRRDKTSPYVFPPSGYDLRYMMARLCKRAKVKYFGFHAIRHHVATLLNDSGKIGIKGTQEFLRHKRQTTTETYLHAMSWGKKQAVDLLDEKIVPHRTAKEEKRG